MMMLMMINIIYYSNNNKAFNGYTYNQIYCYQHW